MGQCRLDASVRKRENNEKVRKRSEENGIVDTTGSFNRIEPICSARIYICANGITDLL